MKARTATLLSSGLLLLGALSITGCDDTQVPQVPGVEEQEDNENQDDDQNENENGEENDEEEDD